MTSKGATLMVLLILLLVLARPGYTEFTRHHIGIGGGGYKVFSDDVVGRVFWVPLHYRYSFNPLMDLVIDGRTWTRTGKWSDSRTSWTTTRTGCSFIGLGVRFNSQAAPFLQGNIYLVEKK